MVRREVTQRPPARLKRVVVAVGWPTSSFLRQSKATKERPGPAPNNLQRSSDPSRDGSTRPRDRAADQSI